MRQFGHLAAILLLAGLSGCQCSPLTEHYADAVDHFAYNQPKWDFLYHPCFDLTRIGQPDWCQCFFNRMWCHRGCGGPYCDSSTPICCPFCARDFPPYEPPAVTPAGHQENGGSPARQSETVPPKPASSAAKPPEPERPGSSKPPVPDMPKNGPPIPEMSKNSPPIPPVPPKTSARPPRLISAQTGRPIPEARGRSIFRWK